MDHSLLIAILILSPLVGFIVNSIFFNSEKALGAGIIGTTAIAISFLCALNLFFQLIGLPVEQRSLRAEYFTWMSIGNLHVPAAFVVDQISGVMILIITGVGSLIHLFSASYMSHDPRPFKYFAYLNLFVFNMLLLVLGENLLLMFVGWEGVGLCSYLLIGFWFTDSAKAAAGMKAFVTNRIGDAGLLLGIFLLFQTFGTIHFAQLNAAAPVDPESSWGIVTIACLFLFVGAMGKSAQIPLYVWLPDAMAGPTPVSALIHAATMVTAGVYMIVRLNHVFMSAPNAMMVIAIIGATTALFAASIGLAQNDIKKVLAYSTVSQLGYMFLAAGVGAFGPAMFHLMTHAFFKALMFLGSGSVIHSMHEEQDMRKMGGLKKYMPITHFTFLMGWLAIIGMPPFAGFFSKDEILWKSFHSPHGHILLWLMGVLAAAFTAFYMTRLMAMTFWGKSRVSKDIHPHESPWPMTVPLIVLAVLSVIGGWIGIPHVISHGLHLPFGNIFEEWLSPLLKYPEEAPASAALEWGLMGLSVLVAGCSAWLAYSLYVGDESRRTKITGAFGPLKTLIENKYYVDELFNWTLVRPLVRGSQILWAYVDVKLIDKITYLAGDMIKDSAQGLRQFQTGNVQQYALYIVLGLVAILFLI